jgi:hypothetical protein
MSATHKTFFVYVACQDHDGPSLPEDSVCDPPGYVDSHVVGPGCSGLCVYRKTPFENRTDASSTMKYNGIQSFFRDVVRCSQEAGKDTSSSTTTVDPSSISFFLGKFQNARRACFLYTAEESDCQGWKECLQQCGIGPGIECYYGLEQKSSHFLTIASKVEDALMVRNDIDIVYLVITVSDNSHGIEGHLDDMMRHLDGVRGFTDSVFVCLTREWPGHNIFDIIDQEDHRQGHPSCTYKEDNHNNIHDGTLQDPDDAMMIKLVRPPQSFMFSGNTEIQEEIDRSKVGTFVYRLPGITRVDYVKSFSDVHTIYHLGGHKCILAERIVYEIAYKIGLGNKYGA